MAATAVIMTGTAQTFTFITCCCKSVARLLFEIDFCKSIYHLNMYLTYILVYCVMYVILDIGRSKPQHVRDEPLYYVWRTGAVKEMVLYVFECAMCLLCVCVCMRMCMCVCCVSVVYICVRTFSFVHTATFLFSAFVAFHFS